MNINSFSFILGFLPITLIVYHDSLIRFLRISSCEELHQQLDPLFDEQDYIWDFNAPEYESFTRDHSNYCDHCHLSRQGAEWMVKEIEKKIAGRV